MPSDWFLRAESQFAAADFPPGSFVFRTRHEHAGGPFQHGLRVGDGSEVYCLNEWHDGNYGPHDLVDLSDKRLTVWGFKPGTSPIIAVTFDLSGGAHRTPNVGSSGGGYLGLGPAGISVHAQRGRHDPMRRGEAVFDPVTWLEKPLEPHQHPTAWISRWSLVVTLDSVAIQTLAVVHKDVP